MGREIGWAEPGFVIGQPRTQKVAGFHYLFVEEKHVAESAVGDAMDRLFPKLFAAGACAFGAAGSPPVLAMFIDLEPKMYDVQLGFAVQAGTAVAGNAQIRYVEPALVASIVVGGGIESVIRSYGPLMEYMTANGLKCVEGWREWHLYWENDSSANNINWVQHVAEEAYCGGCIGHPSLYTLEDHSHGDIPSPRGQKPIRPPHGRRIAKVLAKKLKLALDKSPKF